MTRALHLRGYNITVPVISSGPAIVEQFAIAAPVSSHTRFHSTCASFLIHNIPAFAHCETLIRQVPDTVGRGQKLHYMVVCSWREDHQLPKRPATYASGLCLPTITTVSLFGTCSMAALQSANLGLVPAPFMQNGFASTKTNDVQR